MYLCNYQSPSVLFVICSQAELAAVPTPQHVTDLQTGEFMAEFGRDSATLVALRLCGIKGLEGSQST